MAVFIKKVDPSQVEQEAHFQHCAWLYRFAPEVYKTTTDEIHMEDLQEMCLADKYGDDPAVIPAYIWVSIRIIIHTLYYEECIEYIDITPYNFIEKDKKVYIIDFGHAEYTTKRPEMNWFVKEFLDGENGWNPDFK
jgi:tRNA A-37 threonylcarbamoyl transferase component Bud32